jgi:chromosome segregation ATPase
MGNTRISIDEIKNKMEEIEDEIGEVNRQQDSIEDMIERLQNNRSDDSSVSRAHLFLKACKAVLENHREEQQVEEKTKEVKSDIQEVKQDAESVGRLKQWMQKAVERLKSDENEEETQRDETSEHLEELKGIYGKLEYELKPSNTDEYNKVRQVWSKMPEKIYEETA